MYQRSQPVAPPAAESKPIELIPSRVIRQADWPELPSPIPGLLEGYLTILAGAGGVGKTYLAEQIARHLASGVQLGRFPLPLTPLITWFLVLEDVEALTQARSLDVARFGTLEEDASPEDTGWDTLQYITDAGRGIPGLRERFELAKATGDVPGAVIIDYLHLFIGSQPSGVNPVEWERRRLTELRELGQEYGAHILVLTHMTKEGKVNGTSALLNACDAMYTLALKDDRDYAALVCTKMRLAPMTDYALCRKANGSWGFDDQVLVSEAMAEGIAKGILRVLREEGPHTLSMLVAHHRVGGERAGIRAALSRSRAKGWIKLQAGHWHIVRQAGDEMLAAQPQRLCAGCHLPMVLQGEQYHPLCDPDVTPPVGSVPPARASEDDEWVRPSTAEERAANPALESLKDSIKASRYKPRPVVPKRLREQEPWSLITEEMGGEPKWLAPGWSTQRVKWREPGEDKDSIRYDLVAPGDWPVRHGMVVTLDRNGSFPSACSSVPLAPNALVHTGPMESHDGRAGMFQVELAKPWDTELFPHPLGKAQLPDNCPSWCTAPHVRLLDKLGLEYTIHDSYTGKANDSLFERFYKDAKRVREENDGQGEEYLRWKPKMGSALRLLWPKDAPSPFWRPDWRVGMVAEASVRHWLKAWGAAAAGARLVALANVDEAAYWIGEDLSPVPTYKLGTKYGQVEIKRLQDGLAP